MSFHLSTYVMGVRHREVPHNLCKWVSDPSHSYISRDTTVCVILTNETFGRRTITTRSAKSRCGRCRSWTQERQKYKVTAVRTLETARDPPRGACPRRSSPLLHRPPRASIPPWGASPSQPTAQVQPTTQVSPSLHWRIKNTDLIILKFYKVEKSRTVTSRNGVVVSTKSQLWELKTAVYIMFHDDKNNYCDGRVF